MEKVITLEEALKRMKDYILENLMFRRLFVHDNRMFAERAFYCFQIYIMMHKKATADLGKIPKMCSGFFLMASFSSVLPAS